jgi:signal transduction histidine kinase
MLVCLIVLVSTGSVPQILPGDSIEHVLHTCADISVDERLPIYESLSAFYCTNDTEKTMEYALAGLELAIEKGNYKREAAFYRYIGGVHDVRGNVDSAMYYYRKSYDVAIRHNDKYLEVQFYRMQTFTYFRQGRYLDALKSCMNVLAQVEESGDFDGKIGSLGCIGEIYQILGNTERALYYTRLSLEMTKEHQSLFLTMQLYNIMGAIYRDMKEYDEALKYQQLALEESRLMNNSLNESVSLLGFAKVYLLKEEYDKALIYAQQSLTIAEQMNDPTLLVGSLHILANVYRKQKRYAESESMATRAWAVDSTNLDTAPSLAHTIILSNIYLQNYGKAIEFLSKSEQLNNKEAVKNLHKSLLEMEIKNESEKQEMRITSLEKEKDLYTMLGLASMVIFILLIGLFLFRHRLVVQKRKTAEQLATQQALLEGETTERTRLARDLHDGLGGVLSAVKLNLRELGNTCSFRDAEIQRYSQALLMIDKAVVELSRVAHHMMPESLIHSGLKTSIEDFCRVIPGASFLYLGDDNRLDSRLEILIYRCTYELVNNALKHAKASAIQVQLLVDRTLVSLAVQDNGTGFDPVAGTTGTGLKNIRERIAGYNGKINIYSSPGNGTEVNIEIERI